MIRLTGFDHSRVLLNSDLIQHVEDAPDTTIVLSNGEVFRVLETPEQVRALIVQFRREIMGSPAPRRGLRPLRSAPVPLDSHHDKLDHA